MTYEIDDVPVYAAGIVLQGGLFRVIMVAYGSSYCNSLIRILLVSYMNE